MQHQKILIRKYTEPDRSSLINFWQAVFPDDPPHNYPPQVIEAKLAVDDLIYLAKIKSTLVGACMVGYDGHRGWLYAVGVSEQHRRQNIGSTLVKHVLNALKDMGCAKVNIQIRATNSDVVSFYKSLGFTLEDRLSMGSLIG